MYLSGDPLLRNYKKIAESRRISKKSFRVIWMTYISKGIRDQNEKRPTVSIVGLDMRLFEILYPR